MKHPRHCPCCKEKEKQKKVKPVSLYDLSKRKGNITTPETKAK